MADTTRPRWECGRCGLVEYVKLMGRDCPRTAKRRLEKRHRNCDGELRYSAGVLIGPRSIGELVKPLRCGVWENNMNLDIGVDGRVRKPVKLTEECELYGLSGLKSLAGVKLAKRCWLSGLSGLKSLAGVKFANGCKLCGYLPWVIVTRWGNLGIGCETVYSDTTDEQIKKAIRRNNAQQFAERIMEVVELWRAWRG